jgi:hypothetical protein
MGEGIGQKEAELVHGYFPNLHCENIATNNACCDKGKN